jgi:HAD superfamily hydrolase (TIGR01509 family)
MTIRAVLFDLGGPIDLEILHEASIDLRITEAFAASGVVISRDDLDLASERAVVSFAPDAYGAMIWTIAAGDSGLAAEVHQHFRQDPLGRAQSRGGVELRPGIGALLTELAGKGLKLGLAANQPARVIAELDRLGVGEHFSHREVSGHHGFHKPDVRLFLRACEVLAVEPAECIMVGDRIDNDIFPARVLGMRTVLFRTGRHIRQQPRSPAEVPDAVVEDVEELRNAILRLVDGS